MMPEALLWAIMSDNHFNHLKEICFNIETVFFILGMPMLIIRGS